jgi:hypothetical protein
VGARLTAAKTSDLTPSAPPRNVADAACVGMRSTSLVNNPSAWVAKSRLSGPRRSVAPPRCLWSFQIRSPRPIESSKLLLSRRAQRPQRDEPPTLLRALCGLRGKTRISSMECLYPTFSRTIPRHPPRSARNRRAVCEGFAFPANRASPGHVLSRRRSSDFRWIAGLQFLWSGKILRNRESVSGRVAFALGLDRRIRMILLRQAVVCLRMF